MKQCDTTDSVCITTFAKVTATISHEIKNTLSIINENAGLLDDLVMLAQSEVGVEPTRVKNAAATIARQVSRANEIMNNVNKFAHSADNLTGRESLLSICSLMVTLTERQALSKNIVISLNCDFDVEIHTYILRLESLIYLTIRTIIDHSEDGEALDIDIRTPETDTIAVSFTSACISETNISELHDDKLKSIMDSLHASFSVHDNMLMIVFPNTIGE